MLSCMPNTFTSKWLVGINYVIGDRCSRPMVTLHHAKVTKTWMCVYVCGTTAVPPYKTHLVSWEIFHAEKNTLGSGHAASVDILPIKLFWEKDHLFYSAIAADMNYDNWIDLCSLICHFLWDSAPLFTWDTFNQRHFLAFLTKSKSHQVSSYHYPQKERWHHACN